MLKLCLCFGAICSYMVGEFYDSPSDLSVVHIDVFSILPNLSDQSLHSSHIWQNYHYRFNYFQYVNLYMLQYVATYTSVAML